MRTTRSRNGTSSFVIKENSKLEPSCKGLQYPGAAPCGCQMPTKRLTESGPAAVWRNGVCAGSIDSRKGKANVTPQPCRNVRRGMCFFVINIIWPPDGRYIFAILTLVRYSDYLFAARSLPANSHFLL